MPITEPSGGQSAACNKGLSARRPRLFSVALCWRKRGGFNFAGTGRPVVRVYPDGTVAAFRLLPQRRGGVSRTTTTKVLIERTERLRQEAAEYRGPDSDLALMGEMDALVELQMLKGKL